MDSRSGVVSYYTHSGIHRWYNCRTLAVTDIAVHRTIATAIDIRLGDYG